MIANDTLYLFDNKKEIVTIIHPRNVLMSEQTAEINAVIEHVVQALYVNEVEQAQYFGMKDIDDPANFLMYKIDRLTVDAKNGTFTIKGTHIFFDDLSGRGGIVEELRPTNEPVELVLAEILSGTGWEVGEVHTTNTMTADYSYKGKRDVFWDFIKRSNVEFSLSMKFEKGQIVRKLVHLHNEIGEDLGKWYEYGDKLVTVQKEVESTNVYTAFIGVGKEITEENGTKKRLTFEDVEWSVEKGDPLNKPLGQNFIELPEATAKYGYEDGSARFKPIHFNDVEVPEQLLEMTYKQAVAESRPKVHFKSSAIDNEVVHLGETVRIVRADLNIRYKTRIFKIVRDFKRVGVKEFEFGDKLIYTPAERIRKQKDEVQNMIQEVAQEVMNEQPDDDPNVQPWDAMIVVKHGWDATVERPDYAYTVYWVGSVAPMNAEEGDLWIGGTV